MRHLYAAATEPGVSFLIDKAKLYERRRCDHRPEEYPEPLSTKECLASVVDPKDSKTNKHRYVVASQEQEVRKYMRSILGVPLVYINRSVMIMEPMAGATADSREREERVKLRAGLKSGRGSGGQGTKRKRESDGDDKAGAQQGGVEDGTARNKAKHEKGPKGPNPLAVKKPKKKVDGEWATSASRDQPTESGGSLSQGLTEELDPNAKRRRRRKHKSGGNNDMVEMANDDE